MSAQKKILIVCLVFAAIVFSSILPTASRADDTEALARLYMLKRKPGETANFLNHASGINYTARYRVLLPQGRPILRRMHEWEFKITDAKNRIVRGAKILIQGQMPQHGHGFNGRIQVRELGQGRYLASGFKFFMPGWWMISMQVSRDQLKETLFFDLQISPHTDLQSADRLGWSRAELSTIQSLGIQNLLPLDARDHSSNRYALNPEAAALGQMLFSDTSLSRSKDLSCATCHQSERAFSGNQAFDLPGIGPRKAPSLIGVGWQTWFYWDGRKDSLWSQALSPFENPSEYAQSRDEIVRLVILKYGAQFRKIFGPVSAQPQGRELDRAFANIGKAIAAYEITLQPQPSAFDQFVSRLADHKNGQDVTGFERDGCARQGLKVFIGKGRCINCHNGPRLEDDAFHNTGLLPPLPISEKNGYGDRLGRTYAVELALADPFNCKSRYSDDPLHCQELEHLKLHDMTQLSAFKTPTLRNVALTAPYMHGGQLTTLEEVIDHYDQARAFSAGETELVRLGLTADEKKGLSCFLRSLTEVRSKPDDPRAN